MWKCRSDGCQEALHDPWPSSERDGRLPNPPALLRPAGAKIGRRSHKQKTIDVSHAK
jgi:hypothetical protein